MVCCVTNIGMDNLALMNLRMSVICMTQNVASWSANAGASHQHIPITQKAPCKGKCYNLRSSYTLMGKMSTQPIHLVVRPKIVKCKELGE